MEKKMERTGLLETMSFKSKEELLEGLERKISKIMAGYPKEKKDTQAYKEYEAFLKKFYDKVKLMELPKILDEEWTYSFGISDYGCNISLDKLKIENEKSVEIIASYRLKKFEPRLLPASEYAKLHGVSDTTVRQWIRRGKLRIASKYGNTWRIPEFAEPNKGQYCNVLIGWDTVLTELLPEYEFLNDYDEVQIQQISKEEYKVWIANNKTRKYVIKRMDRKERERFELMLIANPFASLYDIPIIDVDALEKSWNKI